VGLSFWDPTWFASVFCHAGLFMVDEDFRSVKIDIPHFLVEQLFQGVAVVQNNCLVYANPGLSDLSGFTFEELRGSSCEELFDRVIPECQAQVRTTFNNIADGFLSPMWLELAFTCKEGSVRWVDIYTGPTNYRGQPAILLGISDITTRKNNELEVRKSEAKLRSLFDSVPICLYESTPEGKIVEINQAGMLMLGFQTREELYSINASLLYVTPSDRERWKASVDQEGVLRNFVFQLRRQDGTHLWVMDNSRVIRDSNGKVILYQGSLEDITERKRFEDEGQQTTAQLATWVDELKLRNRESLLLNTMGELLQSCLTIEEMNKVIAQSAAEIFQGQAGAFYLYKKSVNLLETVATWGPGLRSEAIFAPDGCWGLRRGRPHVVADSQVKLRCRHIIAQPGQAGLLPYLCIPMTAQGETLGLLYVESQDAKLIEYRSSLATNFAERIALALANLRLRESLRTQAIRDPLTSLFNRRYMEETLERELRRAIRHRHSIGVIMIDADHFRTINNTVGHGAGDAMLQSMARFLQAQIRLEDTPCRYGGDEFVLILPDSTLDDTYKRAEQLRQGIKQITIQHAGRILGAVTISLGVACCPEHGMTVEEVLLAADKAMFRAKEEGRDRTLIADK
jgi:diguanylate cyclase (GGDEF)-like protein/PAS domain S-box-containing protein